MTDQAEQVQETAPTPSTEAEQEHTQVPAWRLMGTLAVAGVLAGLLIVIVYNATQPTIQAYKAEMLKLAVQEVLKGPERYETLYVHNGALVATVPEGLDAKRLERVYIGYRADDQPVGYAIAASGPGFQDVVKLIFGYDLTNSQLLGMKVLENKETPGLGDKIERDAKFVGQFTGIEPTIIGVKAGEKSPDDPSQVEMMTGATISSRTVIRLINQKLESLQPLLSAHGGGASQ